MRTVQIAELKNKLSAYLTFVRAGEEILIRDRAVPIAKIVPLGLVDIDEDEKSLVAEGLLKLPRKSFDADAFFANGRGLKPIPGLRKAIERAMTAEREDLDVSLLGRQFAGSRIRARARNKPRQTTPPR